ncbi:MAG: hypothetical protein ACFB12_03965 [Leptolyngbyaceae cyanobacterium]
MLLARRRSQPSRRSPPDRILTLRSGNYQHSIDQDERLCPTTQRFIDGGQPVFGSMITSYLAIIS